MQANHSIQLPRWLRARYAFGALVLGVGGVIAAGCGDDDTSSASDLTIDVLSPTDGDAVSGPFELSVEASVPFDEPDTGLHHMHVYHDGNTSDGEYDIVYGTTVQIDRLGPGEHTIEAAIANADHSLTGASDTITVDIGGNGEGGNGSTVPAPASTVPGYDY